MAILKKGNMLGVAVHHSVYKPAKNLAELKTQASLFNTWHKTKSWAEATKTPSAYPYISYHYLMATNGEMLKVTDEKYVKYHSGDNFRGDLSFNLHGIAVCLTGNYENDKPTEAQMKALVLFIRDVEKRYDINARIRGHKETSSTPTACPGKNIGTSTSGWLKQVIVNVNDKTYPPATPEPEPDCKEYIAKVDTLTKEKEALEAKLESCNSEKTGLMATNAELVKLTEKYLKDIEVLQELYNDSGEQVAEGEEELKKCENKYTTLKIEYNTLRNTNMELVKELNELKNKQGIIKEFIEWIGKVFGKNND
jgi:hypothetical protein